MFDTGMPICEAFAQVEHQPNIYDVVHVKYLDEVCTVLLWLNSLNFVSVKYKFINDLIIIDATIVCKLIWNLFKNGRIGGKVS